MKQSIEENFIDYISDSLPLYSRQRVAHRFLCPYCQSSGRGKNGKPIAPSGAKGYFYPYGNAWNFKCHKCGEHQSFEKFLEAQYPLLHLQYVRLRDQLGTTGYQTNCPTLETLLSKRGILSHQPPVFRKDRDEVVPVPPAEAPKVTKLPPMRSPQQQAGHQSRLNHLMKQRQQQRRQRQGW